MRKRRQRDLAEAPTSDAVEAVLLVRSYALNRGCWTFLQTYLHTRGWVVWAISHRPRSSPIPVYAKRLGRAIERLETRPVQSKSTWSVTPWAASSRTPSGVWVRAARETCGHARHPWAGTRRTSLHGWGGLRHGTRCRGHPRHRRLLGRHRGRPSKLFISCCPSSAASPRPRHRASTPRPPRDGDVARVFRVVADALQARGPGEE